MSRHDRRSVLKAGGGLLAAASLAGCTEVDEVLDDGFTDRTASIDDGGGELTAGKVAFVEERPPSRDRVEPMAEAVFTREEREKQLYVELDGVATRESTSHITYQVTATNEDGEEIESWEQTVEREERSGDTSNYYLMVTVRIGPPHDPGDYDVHVEITDQLTEESVEVSEELRIKLGLETDLADYDIAELSLIEGQALDYGEYDERDSHVYAPGQQVGLYYTVPGVSYERVGSGSAPRLEETITLTNDASEVVHTTTAEYERTFPEEDMTEFFLRPTVRIPTTVQNGRYTLTVELEDHLSGHVVTDSLDLHIHEDGDLDFRIENVTASLDEPTGYGEVTELPQSGVEPGTDVWVYAEVVDAFDPDDAAVETETEIGVYPPDGDPTYEETFVDRRDSAEEYYLTAQVPIGEESGLHSVNLWVTDSNAGVTYGTGTSVMVDEDGS